MAGLIPPATLEQIRAASDIVDVIGAAVPLKRAGANFVGLCPFHKEKSPSFNVSPSKQVFKCFGCGKGGDVFSFIKEYENVTFVDAVRRLAERARIPLQFEAGPGAEQARSLKETLLQIHNQIAQRWQTALANDANGQIARDYLAKRGVSDDAVKLFRLGYAPDAWDDTVNWAKSKGYDLDSVEKAGLIIKKEGTDRHYDRFRGRLMFPICDEQGRVIGFSGRVLSGDEKTAKYVNSPETPIFTKGKVMFGLDKSKRAILDAGFAIICEGQLDLIACFIAGIKNIVAPQGTAFTGEHARVLKRYADEVVLCFDSDNAGQNAAVRALDDLLASGLAIRVAVVPAPHDPDSYIKQFGAAAMQEVINRAESFFDFHLNRLCVLNEITTDRGRLAVVHAMSEALRKTGNNVLLDSYGQKTAQRLGVSPDAIWAEFRKAPARRPAPATSEEPIETQTEPETPRPSPLEFWLLKLAYQQDELIEWLAGLFDSNWVQHAAVKRLITLRVQRHTAGTWISAAALLSELEDDAEKSLLVEALAEPREVADPPRELTDVLTRLRNQFLDRAVVQLNQQIAAPATPAAEQSRLLRELQHLRALKRLPLADPAVSDA